jgi:hypothetical protein
MYISIEGYRRCGARTVGWIAEQPPRDALPVDALPTILDDGARAPRRRDPMAATLAGWHDLYVTVGAAAATLVGLLFVGLSLHIRVVVAHGEVRSLARVTLTAFFAVLMVSVAVLQPTDSAGVVADWLVVIAIVSLVLTVKPLRDGLARRCSRALDARTIVARFGVAELAFAALLVCASLLAAGRAVDALNLLLGVVVLLLVVSVRNTWDLLVTVAASLGADDR